MGINKLVERCQASRQSFRPFVHEILFVENGKSFDNVASSPDLVYVLEEV